MEMRVSSLEIKDMSSGRITIEVELYDDNYEVARQLDSTACLQTTDWSETYDYYSDQIDELVDHAKEETKQELQDEMEELKDKIKDLEAEVASLFTAKYVERAPK